MAEVQALPGRFTQKNMPDHRRGSIAKDSPARLGLLNPSLIESLGLRFFHWPENASSETFNAYLSPAQFDAILVRERAEFKNMAPILISKGLHLLPVIDMTGELGACADLDASMLAAHNAKEIIDLAQSFEQRRARLSPEVKKADQAEIQLLSRLFVSTKPLLPRLSAKQEGLVLYNTIFQPADIEKAAKMLVKRGLLKETFFDRVSTCPSCMSARFNVKEECPTCSSANLAEESYLHHFRCAYEGPESDFECEGDLICPKCSRELRHFGKDYDRPGQMLMCGSCGTATSEPNVTFSCLDCGTKTDGDKIEARDIFSYALTEDGQAYLETGPRHLGLSQKSLHLAGMPLELVAALNSCAKAYKEKASDFTLLGIAYECERAVTQEHGAKQFEQAKKLFLETLQQQLGRNAEIFNGISYDFALLRGTASFLMREKAIEAIKAARQSTRHDLGAYMTILEPEDLV